jgi:hypothetical protein
VEPAESIIRTFEQAVAGGRADVKTALSSLRDLDALRKMASRAGKQPSRGFAPSTIIQWLLSTYPGRQLMEATEPFASEFDHLIPSLLVGEGRQVMQLEYLLRILAPDSSFPSEASSASKRAGDILRHNIIAYFGHDGNPSNALQFYLDVHRLTWKHHVQTQSAWGRQFYLRSAGVLQTYFLDHRPVSPQLEKSYDQLISIVNRLRSPFMLARLHVLHPTRPSLDSALALIRKDMEAKTSPTTLEASSRMRRHLVQLGLLASKELMEQQQFDEATKILLFLGEYYPRELNLPKKVQESTLEQTEKFSSQDTLSILDKLALD